MIQINNQIGLCTPQIQLQKARLSLHHLKRNSKSAMNGDVNILVFYFSSCVLDEIALTNDHM